MKRATSVMGAVALAVVAGGCNLLLGIDKDYVVGDRDGGGGAGGGGETSATSGTSTIASTSVTSSTSASATSSTSTGSSTSTSTTSSTTSGGGGGCTTGMVSTGAFCIDATEVTNGEYAAWLATGPSTAGQPSFCTWNNDFAPAAGWPASDMGAPVVNVDWCDAYAYCAAAGKRLCGRVGGGAAGYAKFDDPAHSEWMAACSNGGATKYPYGAAYGGGICNGKDFTHPNHPLPAAAAASCHGAAAPYSAVFDMSGNVAEWEDACSGASGASDMCRARGGSFKSGASALRCNADAALGRASADDATGFRCCSD